MNSSNEKEIELFAKYDTVLALIRDGIYSLEEAEKLIGIKLPEDFKAEHLSTKNNGFYIKTKTGERPDYLGWSQWFQNKYKFVYKNESYIYDDTSGHYRQICDTELENLLIKTTQEKAKPQHFALFIKNLKALCFDLGQSFKSTEHKINVDNGVLDLQSGQLLPHSHEYFFTYKIPIKYDATAKCDEWMAFLERIFPENPEFKIICAQIFGYIIYGGDPWLHKAFVLHGEGRNGKSTFLHILQKLIGSSNFSSVSLANLNKPFSCYRLDDKLANITGETPSDKINAEIFKEATSGGMVTAARKFQDEYDFQCKARFIFACNDLPRFGENTVGMQERLYFIPFIKFFEKSERRNDIKQVLEAEMSGILNWAISGLQILLDERYLPETNATNDIMDEYKMESDSVFAWASEYVQIHKDLSIKNKATNFYHHYKSYAKDNNRGVVSDRSFYKRLKKYLKQQNGYSDAMHDKNNKVYRGISIKSDSDFMTNNYYQ